MVWGVVGGLYFLPKNTIVNAERYTDVLDDYLLLYYEILGCEYFLQDSVPYHKAKSVTKWLCDHNVHVSRWPGNSPGLKTLRKMYGPIWNQSSVHVITSSVPHLNDTLSKIWVEDLDHQYFQNLASSVPKRLQMVYLKSCQMIVLFCNFSLDLSWVFERPFRGTGVVSRSSGTYSH